MTIPFHRFQLTETIGVTAFNAGLNAAYTAYLWHGSEPVAVSQVATDLAGTPAVIALLATLFGTAAVRRKIADGRVGAPAAERPGVWPANMVSRALLFASLCLVFISLPLWLMFATVESVAVPYAQAVTMKVLLTVVFSGAIVPIVVRAAASDVRRTASRLQRA